MTRTDNIKKNLVFNIVKFTTQLVLQFVLRTVLIYYMGIEYLGLNGLFTNIFAFLNLAELGIGSAIVFAMYKPIAEGDIEQVKALQNLYKKFYVVITLIVLGVGLSLTPFLRWLIKGGVSVDINIYVLYLMYLANTVVGYLSAHKRSLLFAYQRNDIENKVKTLCMILMTLAQIVVLVVTKNYYLFFTINIVFTIIESLLIYRSSKKLFPEITGKAQEIDTTTKKDITKNVAALSMHKIGGIVVYSTDSILISAFFGAIALGAYSNYNLIISTLTSIFLLAQNALSASVGNLIASKDKEYVYQKFKQIKLLFTMLISFCSVCAIVLFQPFITKWTGGGDYLLGFSCVIYMVLSFYILKHRMTVEIFKDSAGLFWQDRWKPIVESLVNLVASIVLAQFVGVAGIFLGTVISSLSVFWVEPKVVYKHYFNKSTKSYFARYLIDLIIMAAVCGIVWGVCMFIPDATLLWLIVKFAVCIGLTGILLMLAYCPTPEFKQSVSFVKNLVFKNKHTKKH